jgi:hypothetical protein
MVAPATSSLMFFGATRYVDNLSDIRTMRFAGG